MTVRIYLRAVRFDPAPPEPTDLPAERVFVHASEVPEVWVETETATPPERGKAVAFALVRPMNIGFTRILGTVERAVSKRTTAGPLLTGIEPRATGAFAPHDISPQIQQPPSLTTLDG
jgi:hypothetical protein